MACRLCNESCSRKGLSPTEAEYQCPVCGKYRISTSAMDALEHSAELPFWVGSWVYQQNLMGMSPLVTAEVVDRIKESGRPDTETRVERYLGAAIKMMDKGHLIGRFSPVDKRLRIASWSEWPDDGIALAGYLEEQGAIENINGQEKRLLAKGHLIYEKMSAKRASSSQAFVAMWFDPSLTPVFEQGLAPAVTGAGYSPLRIDRSEHADKIDDRIIAEIRRSAFVVADFTEHRGGVYYEAGFAHGLGRPVIFTCRKDHLEHLHFDVRQYNTIDWEQPSDIVKPLQNRILALFGAGPSRPDAKPIE